MTVVSHSSRVTKWDSNISPIIHTLFREDTSLRYFEFYETACSCLHSLPARRGALYVA